MQRPRCAALPTIRRGHSRSPEGGRARRERAAFHAFAAAAVAGLSLLASACGGTSAPRVAQLGTTTVSSTDSAQSGGSRSGTALDKFVACMRSHHVTQFPSPTSSGATIALPGKGVDPNSPQYKTALQVCSRLLPNGGPLGPTLTPAEQVDYLKAAACMRAHSFAGFPDPTFTNGHVTFRVPANVDDNTQAFLKAETTCRKLIPAGLPYSS